MKKAKIILSVFSALAIAAPTYAVDPNEPGKASDSVKQPAAPTTGASSPAATSTGAPAGSEPGKSSDTIREDISNKTTDSSDAKSGTSYHGKITAIDKSDKIVTIDDQKMGKQKLHIDDSTKLMKGDNKASWDDLKVGQELHGSLKKMEGDKHHAISATVGK